MWFRKQNKREKKRRQWFTRHHNLARARNGNYSEWNIYHLTASHHEAYHKLFGNRTFEEAAKVLLRMQETHEIRAVVR